MSYSKEIEQEAIECTRHDVCRGCGHNFKDEYGHCVGEFNCLEFQVYKDATIAEWEKEFEKTEVD